MFGVFLVYKDVMGPSTIKVFGWELQTTVGGIVALLIGVVGVVPVLKLLQILSHPLPLKKVYLKIMADELQTLKFECHTTERAFRDEREPAKYVEKHTSSLWDFRTRFTHVAGGEWIKDAANEYGENLDACRHFLVEGCSILDDLLEHLRSQTRVIQSAKSSGMNTESPFRDMFIEIANGLQNIKDRLETLIFNAKAELENHQNNRSLKHEKPATRNVKDPMKNVR